MGTHLVLDEELDTLNGGGSGLGNGGGDTTHCELLVNHSSQVSNFAL